jgi:hypothetical protein
MLRGLPFTGDGLGGKLHWRWVCGHDRDGGEGPVHGGNPGKEDCYKEDM